MLFIRGYQWKCNSKLCGDTRSTYFEWFGIFLFLPGYQSCTPGVRYSSYFVVPCSHPQARESSFQPVFAQPFVTIVLSDFQLCSQNNSNNNLTLQPSPDVLTPTENLPQMPPFAPSSTSEPQPLMFRNPAYKLSDRHRSSRTSLSQLHDSLNLQNSSMLRNFKPEKQVTDASKPNDNHQGI